MSIVETTESFMTIQISSFETLFLWEKTQNGRDFPKSSKLFLNEFDFTLLFEPFWCGPAVIFLFWTRMKFQKETLTKTKWEYDLNRRGAWVRSVDRFFTILSASLAIGFLHLTILQNHWVNIFSTINTLPHPKALGFIINLFVNHHTTTTVASRKSFFHPSPPLERGSFIRVVDLKIPGATILSILKMRLWKLSFNRLGRNFRRHNLLILRRRQIPPFRMGLKATLRINPEQTPGFRPGIVEGLIKPHPGGEGSMKFPPPLVLFGMKF